MTRKTDRLAAATPVELRRQAEETLQEKTASENLDALSPVEIQRLLHELSVHQIELERQNEELRHTQDELEAERARYFDFYNLAPVGFVTLSEQGLILEANLTAVSLLGVPQSALVGHPFDRFILKKDADIHYLRRSELIATGKPQAYELRLLKNDGTESWAHLATSAVKDTGDAPVYRIVLSDLNEFKKAEEALRETQAILKAALDNSQVGIAIADAPSGMLRYVNDAGLLMRGSDRQSVVNGIGIDQYVASWQLMDFDGRPLNSDEVPLARAVLFGETCSREFIIRRTQEDDRIVVANAAPIRDEKGKVVAGIVVFTDITGRKQAEDALKENKEKLERLFDLLPVGVSVLDHKRKIVKTNLALEKILHISSEGLLNGAYKGRKYFRPDGTPMPAEEFASNRVMRSLPGEESQVAHVETGIEIEDGTLIWTDVSAVASPFSDWSCILVTTDITERMTAEYRTAQLSAIVESSNDIIISKTLDGLITSWNKGAEVIYGYSETEMIGKPIFLLAPPEHIDEMLQILNKIKSGLTVHRLETVRQRKDGQLIHVALTVSPIRNKEGRVIAASSIGSDITERKQAEEKIRLLNVELEELAMTDQLTNLFNRRYFMRRGVEEFKRAQRYHQHLALLVLDIDEFKKVNDTYGHEAGDLALKQVAAALKSCMRETDMVARLGGDEFVVLLQNTPLNEAGRSVERIQQAIAEMSIQKPDRVAIRPITVSVGAAGFTVDLPGFDDLLRNADAAMYLAKNHRQKGSGLPDGGAP